MRPTRASQRTFWSDDEPQPQKRPERAKSERADDLPSDPVKRIDEAARRFAMEAIKAVEQLEPGSDVRDAATTLVADVLEGRTTLAHASGGLAARVALVAAEARKRVMQAQRDGETLPDYGRSVARKRSRST